MFITKYNHLYVLVHFKSSVDNIIDSLLTVTQEVSKPYSGKRKAIFSIPLWPHLDFGHREQIWYMKGCGTSPWLVLVFPCFRENVVATCKIGSFLCSLDKLLQKNVIVFFFGNQISKWRSFEERAIFDLLFTFFSHQGKVTLNSFSTYPKNIHTRILLTLLTFFVLPILKKKYEFIRYGFSLVWVLVLILIRAILERSTNNKMVSKILVGMSASDMYLH